MRQVGGLLGSVSQGLQGVNHPSWNTVTLPASREAVAATIRVSCLVTTFSASMNPSRKSSVNVIRSEVMMEPPGSLMRTLPTAVRVLALRS
jgi:hypothetical protein